MESNNNNFNSLKNKFLKAFELNPFFAYSVDQYKLIIKEFEKFFINQKKENDTIAIFLSKKNFDILTLANFEQIEDVLTLSQTSELNIKNIKIFSFQVIVALLSNNSDMMNIKKLIIEELVSQANSSKQLIFHIFYFFLTLIYTTLQFGLIHFYLPENKDYIKQCLNEGDPIKLEDGKEFDFIGMDEFFDEYFIRDNKNYSFETIQDIFSKFLFKGIDEKINFSLLFQEDKINYDFNEKHKDVISFKSELSERLIYVFNIERIVDTYLQLKIN